MRIVCCRQRKNEIADNFLSKVGSELASVVVLRDVVPLLLPMGKDAALVNLSIAKANSQVCTEVYVLVIKFVTVHVGKVELGPLATGLHFEPLDKSSKRH